MSFSATVPTVPRWIQFIGVTLGLFMALMYLTSCSPFYVMRAAYEESKILMARRNIETVIKDQDTSQEDREKLALVLEARAFTQVMGLEPGDTYTKYSKVNKDVLAWILAGSKQDAFSLYQWWFPFVGSIPYKGFFDKNDALREESHLLAKGYETWIRGTEAFSTLGWFNDPVLSTTLKRSHVRIVNTVIHETVHRTVWLPDHVDFNESLANFVGCMGAVDFYRARLVACPPLEQSCLEQNERYLKEAELGQQREFELAEFVTALHEKLSELYKSDHSKEEKLKLRTAIFDTLVTPFHTKYPQFDAFKVINNAEIIQFRLYLRQFPLFARLYENSGKNWPAFIEKVRELVTRYKENKKQDPFQLLGKF